MNNIVTLQDFIKRAERNYKYKPNTAIALSSAVRLFASVMTEDELTQGTFPIDKLDEISERIHTKLPNKYSVDSLLTYKSRINRVASDFTNYGADAKSMASWNPLTKQRKRGAKPSNTKQVSSKTAEETIVSEDSSPITNNAMSVVLPGLQDIRLPLADNRSVVIYYPMDLTETEAEKIGTVLKGIASLSRTGLAEDSR